MRNIFHYFFKRCDCLYLPEREGITDSFKMLVPVLSGCAFSIPISCEKGVKTDCSLECFVGESVGESKVILIE